MICRNVFSTCGKYVVDVGDPTSRAERLKQYAAAFAASLSAFAVGTVMAWTSPAGPQLLAGAAGFPVDHFEVSLIGSLMPIGAAVSCVPTGYLTDTIGRKAALLCLIPLFILGWGLIIWPSNVEMIFAGRLLTGLGVGSVCVATPVYITEISSKDIRGELASYFQIMFAGGIVLTYALGSQLSANHLSIACAVVPIIFGMAFLFFPDTPVFYLAKGLPERAKETLSFFRGSKYDVERELKELSAALIKSNEDKESVWEVFTSRRGTRGVSMSVGMMVVQQLCGINAFTFYTTSIFQDAGSSLEPKYATIIVGLMHFAGAVISMFLIDRLGRVVLLGISSSMMAFSTLVMGLYFFLKIHSFDVVDFGWLPLFILCVFEVMFAVGYGTVPWIIMPEILPSRIVGVGGSIACVVNWLCAFLVTKFFSDLVSAFGADVTFWILSVVSLVGVIFSFKVLPETKGKSFEEIQLEISASP